MKIYSSASDGNESADLEPARYFNLAIEQIKEVEVWMRDTMEPAQGLLVHLDIFIHLSKKYPDMAKRRKRSLNVLEIKETFNKWYERCSGKIPKQFREGIKANADQLFSEMEAI
jgi:hypothetical protein